MVNWKSYIVVLLVLAGLSLACGLSVAVETPIVDNFPTSTISPTAYIPPSVLATSPPLTAAKATEDIPPTVVPSDTPTQYIPPPVAATPTRYIPSVNIIGDLLRIPEGFARWYFTAVWATRNYDELWTFQTSSFQNRYSPNGFTQYTDWWQSVERVDVRSVDVIQNDGQYASIQVTMTIYLLNGQIVSERQYLYDLVYNTGRKTWMFDYR
jgi:hypothetical protein